MSDVDVFAVTSDVEILVVSVRRGQLRRIQ